MDDYPQSEELVAFKLYEIEAEYWEEHDQLQALQNNLLITDV